MSSKIKEIEFSILTAPDEKRPHWVSLFRVPSANELLVRMKTDDGVEGFGLATSYTDITPLVNVVKGGLGDEILGMDALSPERLYEKLFGLTFSRKAAENSWGREALIRNHRQWISPVGISWVKWRTYHSTAYLAVIEIMCRVM